MSVSQDKLSAKHRRSYQSTGSASSKVTFSSVQHHSIEKIKSDEEPKFEAADDEEDEKVNLYLRHISRTPQFDSKPVETFKKLIATVNVTILNDSLQQIDVLATMNRLPYTSVDLEFTSLYEKYKNRTDNYDDDFSTDLCHINFNKFKKDVYYLENVIRVTMEDIKSTRNFVALQGVLKNYSLTKEAEDALLSSRQFNQRELTKLRELQENERDDLLEDIRQQATKTGRLKDKFNDLVEKFNVERNVMKHFEKSRRELHDYTLKTSEFTFQNIIEQCRIKSNDENFIHQEITAFLEITSEQYLESIQQWMNKYDEDNDHLEVVISKLKIDLEKEQDDLKELKQVYERRTKEIEDYLEHKRIKALEAKELEMKNYAATRIQAWWRGVMYRRHLGPWRKHKKGKKGKKDSAKSKKKKK